MELTRDNAEVLAGELATAAASRPMIADSRKTVERPWGWGLVVTQPLELTELGYYIISRDAQIWAAGTLVTLDEYMSWYELKRKPDLPVVDKLIGWWKTRGVAKSIVRVRLGEVVADLPIDSLAGELMVKLSSARGSSGSP
jgi:hypothetical protein